MADWHSALDLRGTNVGDNLVVAAEAALDEDERISGDPQALAVIAVTSLQLGYERWRHPIALLVTETTLVFAHFKGIARRVETRKLFRYDCPQYGQPQAVGPSTFRLPFVHETLGPVDAYFATFREAEWLSQYWANG